MDVAGANGTSGAVWHVTDRHCTTGKDAVKHPVAGSESVRIACCHDDMLGSAAPPGAGMNAIPTSDPHRTVSTFNAPVS